MYEQVLAPLFGPGLEFLDQLLLDFDSGGEKHNAMDWWFSGFLCHPDNQNNSPQAQDGRCTTFNDKIYPDKGFRKDKLEIGIAPGDSGGPGFVDGQIAGVHSFGFTYICGGPGRRTIGIMLHVLGSRDSYSCNSCRRSAPRTASRAIEPSKVTNRLAVVTFAGTKSSTRHLNGWTGITTNGCQARSAISRRSSSRQPVTSKKKVRRWLPDSHESVAGIPGVVQLRLLHRDDRIVDGPRKPWSRSNSSTMPCCSGHCSL